MPDDRGHNTLNVMAIVVGAPFAIYYLGYIALPGIAAFLFAALAFNPDLDLDSAPYNHWGWPLKWWWYGYQRWIPHRDSLSHGPILGTMARLLYLSPLVVLILLPFVLTGKTSIEGIEQWAIMHKWPLLSALIGLEASSLLHIIADVISTRCKRLSTWIKKHF
jgi:uncharacterized metal-binding protein